MKNKKSKILLITILLGVFFICNQSLSIYGGDGGELVTTAYIGGIPHAPGFPLYQFLSSIIIKLVPFGTIAFRVTLLSSFSSIISRIFIFLMFYELTSSFFFSLLGIMTYSLTYPVWLFSEVPEVVSFNIMLISMLSYYAIKYIKSANSHYLTVLALIFGLAFFHNYIIILSLPAIIYLIWSRKTKNHFSGNYLTYLLLFLIGALPYIYFIYLSSKYPLIDTNHPTNITGLLSLITRSTYGTFRLSTSVFFNISNGLKNLSYYFSSIFDNYKLFGLFFIICGSLGLFFKKRKIFNFLSIGVVTSIVFYFYASFPLVIDYHMGTFEKYLPIPFFYLNVFLIFGIIYAKDYLAEKISNRTLGLICNYSLCLSLIFYISILFFNNYPRISAIRKDFTAENLGKDILATVSKNAIIYLNEDTSYYNTLYVNNVLGIRKDIKLIKFDNLRDYEYRKGLLIRYPDIYLPNVNMRSGVFYKDFFERNSRKFDIYGNAPYYAVPETWLPYGLLWEYHSTYKSMPKPKEVINTNNKIFSNYHLPDYLFLQANKNLLLLDVLRIYSEGYRTFALLLHKDKQYQSSERMFDLAIAYNPNKIDNYLNLADLYIDMKYCQDAEAIMKKFMKINPKNLDIYKYLVKIYINCYNNSKEAEKYAIIYEKLKSQQE